MKGKILAILNDHRGSAYSGEKLSETLGVSRVSVWKHIKKLQELGYQIQSSVNGYELIDSPDAVYPWEFPEREERIHYQAVVDSTMTLARTLAAGGCPHFTVVIADRQESGRGRLSRQWHSSDGGLYFTLVLRPRIPPALMSRYGFAASFTLVRELAAAYGIKASVKWPNDVLVGGRKLCGILSEMDVSGDEVTFLNIGIGINVNNDPTAFEAGAISISKLLGRNVPRKELLKCFLDAFEREISSENLEHVMNEWKKHTMTIGQDVRIVTVNNAFEGRAVDVDDTGALLLERADGQIEKVFYGDCFHLSGEDPAL